LLLRAAESTEPEVACNALEALVRVAPRDGLLLYRQALRSASPLVRYAALAALGEVRDTASLPLIRPLVEDPSAHVRLAAAFAACRCGQDGYARVLIRAVTDAAEENVRAEAAGLLGRLGEPRARKWLTAAAELPANKRSKPVLLAIYGGLATLGDRGALQELISYSQGDAATRSIALLLLADLGRPDARDALRYRLLSDSEDYDEARLIAARGLGKMGVRDGYALALELLDFTDPNRNPTPENPARTFAVRSMAIHALAEIGDPRALPALRRVAETAQDARLQVAACYAICKLTSAPQQFAGQRAAP
jgi:HEAT repeat protein